MIDLRRIVLFFAAAPTLAAAAVPAAAGGRHHWVHPPVFVATPARASPITPYMFPYGSRYRYNAPGPVYYHLPVWGPHYGCRLWRYNYLYWTC